MANLDQRKRLAELSPQERLAFFEQLKRDKKAQAAPATLPLTRRTQEDGPIPLSFAQQRLWFLEQFEPGTSLYNMPELLQLKGALHYAALQRALDQLVARHEVLRTTFSAIDGEPIQIVAPLQKLALPVIDLQGLSAEDREAESLHLIEQEEQRPFDLVQGPLLRIALLRLAEEEHILILIWHHIISDGWSRGVFVRDLTTLYTAALRNDPSALPALPVQYADFALWQRQWLQGAVLQKQLAYWKNQLANLPALRLPTDHPRPVARSVRGSWISHQVPTHIAARLQELSQQEHDSLFMILLAAFALLLARYTGGDDIPVGTVIANRNRTEVENLIGFFVNTLVLRIDLTGNPNFRALLKRVRDMCLEAYAHQDLPFERLVDEMQPERDISVSNPLIQVMFVLQNAPKNTLTLPGLSLQPLIAETRTAKFDLTLYVLNSQQEMFLETEYNSDLFEEATMQRMLSHLEVMLEAIATDPDQPLASIRLLTAAERQQLLVEWNSLPAQPWPERCLPQVFEAEAAQRPDAVAVVYEESYLTYSALNHRANVLAHALRDLGVGPEVRVGLCMERALEMIVALLALLKAGGAYVPLDPTYPLERLTFMLADAGVSVLVTQQHLRHQFPELAIPIVCLETAQPGDGTETSTNPYSGIAPANLAYIIYTSGSTGRPKGVAVTHANVTRLFSATHSWLPGGTNDVWTLFHSYAFDFSVWEIWGALLCGGRLVIVPYEVSRAPETFLALLQSQYVTVLSQTPSAFTQLLNVLTEKQVKPDLALRWIIFGGEALNLQTLPPWFALYGDQEPRLVNMYGITETTVHVTERSLTQEDPHSQQGSVIGRPLADLQAYLLDADLRPVPVAIPGELYVGGAGLARGYLHNPDLTAERFIPHPFSTQPGQRLYKTGDLARFLPNGQLEYLGRNDQQVKVRGFRIELGEIENALLQHPAVAEAVVVARKRSSDEQKESSNRLLAYLVRRNLSQQTEPQALAAWSDAQVQHWQQVFDTTYGQDSREDDPTFNITGWNSSYTNQPIPAEEMRVWVEQTVERIHSCSPRRVLEIGCGTGLLLLRLAPSCEAYWGSDLSPVALQGLRQRVNALGLSQVRLFEQAADNFEGPLADQQGTFDMIILNSVAQYLPHVAYLVRVLEGAVSLLAPGGTLFIGDVRHLGLLDAFHTSVALRKAPLSLLTSQLHDQIVRRVEQENELLLDPAFFTFLPRHLPQISQVYMQLKRGQQHNELTRFRYDVWLRVGDQAQALADTAPGRVIHWSEGPWTIEKIQQLLLMEEPASVLLTQVPNARLVQELQVVDLLADEKRPRRVDDIWEWLHTHARTALDPEAFWELERSTPYLVSISWSTSDQPGCFDVSFVRKSAQNQPVPALPWALAPGETPLAETWWEAYANDPSRAETLNQLLPELREYLKRKLPDYMLPTLMILDALPLTPSGKVDRRALPEPDSSRPALKSAFVAPRNAREKTLAAIWSRVLGIEQIGIHDNFFELGGDSLMTIRVVSRANQEGLSMTVKQLFSHQTIEELAPALDATHILAEQGPVTGRMPMMPAQRFNLWPHMGDPRCHSMAFIVEGPEPYNPTLVQEVARGLLTYHDALRLRALRQEDNAWELSIAPPDERFLFRHVDLSHLSEAEQITSLKSVITGMITNYDLANEALLRIAVCYLGPHQPTPLIIACHSLVGDLQSWQVLLDSFKTAYQQLSSGGTLHFPAKTTAYKQWAERLLEYARSAALQAELPYWLSEARQNIAPLPMDYPGGIFYGPSMQSTLLMFNEEETETLQQIVGQREELQMEVILLTALAHTFMQWTGKRSMLVTIECHGREPLFDDIDLSRTIGTFAIDYPLLLELENIDDLTADLQAVHTQFHQVPHHGLGYGVLRYMHTDPAIIEQLAALPPSEVFFNYLGTSLVPEATDYKVAGPYNGRIHTLNDVIEEPSFQITGSITHGRLRMQWLYSENQYRSETVQHLAQATMATLRALIARLHSGVGLDCEG
ncbi:MAG TPA: amino acid adenylation domain-containing protein [Ktedonobacteraceae bacterium]|nr:amino acid adenylation domain-containing protein [Ktedonobacteraceae bacterium]